MAATDTSAEQAVLGAVPKQLLIGGKWVDSSSGETLAVEDPATGETLVEIADATVEDAKAALGAADEAFKTFRDVAPRERADILRRAYDAMIEQAEDLALLMTLEMGKPLVEAKAEVTYAAAFLRWYSEEAVRINGRFTVAEAGGSRLLTMKQPIGPCLFITPWNFPLAMGTRKIGPAIAAGCTSVVKPAKQTPLSMIMLAKIFEDAGLPDGVLNVLTASSSGSIMEPLIRDDRLRKLSFTGSTAVGKTLIEQSAEQVLKVSMELGGNAPFLVFEDADLDAAIEGALIAKMRNGGEACTSANRFHVHESVAAEFAEKLAARIGAFKIGRGTDDEVKMGPLIDEAQRTKVADLVSDAVDKGATVLCGGARVDGPGYFYEPTVLTDVSSNADLLSEEIFGPVAPVIGFATDDEAIAAANNTEYGLVAYVFTQDIKRAFKVIERLDTGMVGLNQGLVSTRAPRSAASSSPGSVAKAGRRASRSTWRRSTWRSTPAPDRGAPGSDVFSMTRARVASARA